MAFGVRLYNTIVVVLNQKSSIINQSNEKIYYQFGIGLEPAYPFPQQ